MNVHKLGRLLEFDEKSRDFPIRTLIVHEVPRSHSWECPIVLNQGNVGACVGFSWAHQMASAPTLSTNITETAAFIIYKKAQTLDQYPGENYEGTSVLGGIKAVRKLFPGAVSQYRWAFGLQDVLLTLGYHSPVVLGINWYSDMFSPDAEGIVKATGSITGGHAILARAVDVEKKLVTLHNSWGSSWGKNGECLISFEDLDKLLRQQGEACIPVKSQHVVIK